MRSQGCPWDDGRTMLTSKPTAYWRMPELADDDRVIGGVSGGIGRELGLDPTWVRLGFVVLFATGGFGALFYGLAWGSMTLVERRQARALGPGAERPPIERFPKARSSRLRIIGFGFVVGGLAVLTGTIGGFRAEVVWPLGFLGAGLLLSWQRLATDSESDWGSSRRWLIVAAGMVVATVALIALFSEVSGINAVNGVANAAGSVLLALGAVVALAALSAPWWWRLVRDRDTERQARVRSDERAEVAAHLHDSVLQTLSLIQRNSDDPQIMLNLARRQERELRNWLDPGRASRQGQSVRGQLDELASDVEGLHRVPVEIVAVGDCLIDERIDALLGATREAAVNAAKHSGDQQVDIYVEVADDAIEVFVRDTGKGFDVDAIDPDRQGLRQSIVGRMDRVGGSAVITSVVGEGTEVELRLDREGAR